MEEGMIEIGNIENEVQKISWKFRIVEPDLPPVFTYTVEDKDTVAKESKDCSIYDFYLGLLLSIDPEDLEITTEMQAVAESVMPENKELRWIP